MELSEIMPVDSLKKLKKHEYKVSAVPMWI